MENKVTINIYENYQAYLQGDKPFMHIVGNNDRKAIKLIRRLCKDDKRFVEIFIDYTKGE